MYRNPIIILCLLFCFCCQDVVYGGPLHTWTSKSGKFTIKAELLSFGQGVVSLRRADGKTIKVPLAKLSKDDQNYVANPGAPNGVPDASAMKSKLGDPVINGVSMDEHFEEGEIVLADVGYRTKKKVEIELGEQVLCKVSPRIADFFNEVILNANAKFINQTDQWRQFIYCITFYDSEKKVVAAYATSWTIKPRDDVNFSSALIHGKLEDFKRIASYRIYTCSHPVPPKE